MAIVKEAILLVDTSYFSKGQKVEVINQFVGKDSIHKTRIKSRWSGNKTFVHTNNLRFL